MGHKVQNFLNVTNNRLECLNAKLKQIIRKHSCLEEFVECLFKALDSFKLERESKSAFSLYKRPTNLFKKSSVEEKYFNLLTKYAFDKVLPNINS